MRAFWNCAAMALLGAAVSFFGCSGGQEKTPPAQPSKALPSDSAKKPAVKDAGGEKSASDAKDNAKKSETTKPSEIKMSITKEPFGKTPDGQAVDLYTLTNKNGLKVKIMTYGAIINDVETPDRDGKFENITLSRESLADYIKGHPFFGATVGRYGNRIAKGKFTLDGKEYKLATNDGANHLHGGIKGFDKVVWQAKPVETADSVGVEFTHVSPDGDEGYPGKLSVKTTYTLTNDNELKMHHQATTDKPTVVNLTNHTYWNLSAAHRNVLNEELTLNADKYLPVDSGLIPTGELRPVKGTPMDFTKPEKIGSRIKEAGGYDHCWVINRKPDDKGLVAFAHVVDPDSGRVMDVSTTEPGVQCYSANFLDGSLSRGGVKFEKNYALCLETQHFPDSPNEPKFPSVVLRPGEKYDHLTVHKFSVKK